MYQESPCNMQTINVKKPKYKHKKKTGRNTGIHIKTTETIYIINNKKTGP